MLEPIRRLGLAANREVRAAREVVLEAMGVAAAAGVEVLLDAEQGAWLGLEAHGRELRDFAADCDLVLVFGGDGTFLRAARALERASTPLLGINMGSLGFLTLLKLEDMATALAAILGGAYRLEERMRLTATVIRDGAARNDYLALNDAVVHMSDGNRLVEFRIAVSGQHLGGYRADGLIVATPTGSTAYSLSAGGPIVHPTMDALVATPICPHALSIRPILVGGEEELRVSIGGRSGPAILTLDGADSIPLQSGDQIRIHRAEARALRIALPLDFDYYGLVSEKLGWGVPDGEIAVLTHLRIRNLIVVEEATLELAPGLNVLSGETGAGKSVLLAALALVTGARARTDWIRPDADRAVVEGFFLPSRSVRVALEAQGIEAGEEGLSLRRELRADGRSQAWCEGFPLSVGRLKTLGALLLERQDQHGQLALASEDAQRALVDAAADNRPLLERYAQELEAVRGLRRQEEQLAARLAALREDEDYLRFQLDEIDALAPEPGEREALEQAERRLRNAARLGETYRTLLQRLEGGSGLLEGLGALEGLLERLERLGDVPVDLDLAAVSAPLEELAATLRNRAEDGLLEARRGEDLAERLGRLSALERKHGRDLEAILAWAAEQRELLAQLDDQDALLAERAQVRAEAEAALSRTAAELSKRRRSAAAALGKAWQERLGLLGLERATLRIDVKQEPDPDGWLEIAGKRLRAGPEGADRVEVRIRTNPDLPEGGLGEVPSGGELSRIAFARHLIADRASEPAAPTLILDEVDAGIGADLAGALAEQLEALAGRRQILLVTHQPRLAAVAQRQFCVRKDFGEQRTRTRVVVVEGAEREQEIARMLGEAEPGRETRALAKRLLAAAGRGA